MLRAGHVLYSPVAVSNSLIVQVQVSVAVVPFICGEIGEDANEAASGEEGARQYERHLHASAASLTDCLQPLTSRYLFGWFGPALWVTPD